MTERIQVTTTATAHVANGIQRETVEGLRDIADLLQVEHGKQKDVAKYYADEILSGRTEVKFLNKAIIDKWSVAGLERVKKMAWKIVDQRQTK